MAKHNLAVGKTSLGQRGKEAFSLVLPESDRRILKCENFLGATTKSELAKRFDLPSHNLFFPPKMRNWTAAKKIHFELELCHMFDINDTEEALESKQKYVNEFQQPWIWTDEILKHNQSVGILLAKAVCIFLNESFGLQDKIVQSSAGHRPKTAKPGCSKYYHPFADENSTKQSFAWNLFKLTCLPPQTWYKMTRETNGVKQGSSSKDETAYCVFLANGPHKKCKHIFATHWSPYGQKNFDIMVPDFYCVDHNVAIFYDGKFWLILNYNLLTFLRLKTVQLQHYMQQCIAGCFKKPTQIPNAGHPIFLLFQK
jgi:hypothetical protein